MQAGTRWHTHSPSAHRKYDEDQVRRAEHLGTRRQNGEALRWTAQYQNQIQHPRNPTEDGTLQTLHRCPRLQDKSHQWPARTLGWILTLRTIASAATTALITVPKAYMGGHSRQRDATYIGAAPWIMLACTIHIGLSLPAPVYRLSWR